VCSKKNLEDRIQRIFESDEVAVYGFADLREILDGEFKDYTHAVSFAVKLNSEIVNSIASGPNQEYCDGHVCGICVSVCPFGKREGAKKLDRRQRLNQ